MLLPTLGACKPTERVEAKQPDISLLKANRKDMVSSNSMETTW